MAPSQNNNCSFLHSIKVVTVMIMLAASTVVATKGSVNDVDGHDLIPYLDGTATTPFTAVGSNHPGVYLRHGDKAGGGRRLTEELNTVCSYNFNIFTLSTTYWCQDVCGVKGLAFNSQEITGEHCYFSHNPGGDTSVVSRSGCQRYIGPTDPACSAVLGAVDTRDNTDLEDFIDAFQANYFEICAKCTESPAAAGSQSQPSGPTPSPPPPPQQQEGCDGNLYSIEIDFVDNADDPSENWIFAIGDGEDGEAGFVFRPTRFAAKTTGTTYSGERCVPDSCVTFWTLDDERDGTSKTVTSTVNGAVDTVVDSFDTEFLSGVRFQTGPGCPTTPAEDNASEPQTLNVIFTTGSDASGLTVIIYNKITKAILMRNGPGSLDASSRYTFDRDDVTATCLVVAVADSVGGGISAFSAGYDGDLQTISANPDTVGSIVLDLGSNCS